MKLSMILKGDKLDDSACYFIGKKEFYDGYNQRIDEENEMELVVDLKKLEYILYKLYRGHFDTDMFIFTKKPINIAHDIAIALPSILSVKKG